MLGILSVHYSKSDCGHIFSLILKNRSELWSFISDAKLESLIVKGIFSGYCYDKKFDVEFFKTVKSATSSKV